MFVLVYRMAQARCAGSLHRCIDAILALHCVPAHAYGCSYAVSERLSAAVRTYVVGGVACWGVTTRSPPPRCNWLGARARPFCILCATCRAWMRNESCRDPAPRQIDHECIGNAAPGQAYRRVL